MAGEAVALQVDVSQSEKICVVRRRMAEVVIEGLKSKWASYANATAFTI